MTERFEIAIDQAEIDDLHRRLDATRWPDDPGNEGWVYGVERDWLRALMHYWRHDYDWRLAEAAMNRFDHYRIVLDEVPVHFIHRRSRRPGAIPLVLTHGWPWTFWDYAAMIEPLADPADASAPAFDVVVPSLPGFGFSASLRRTGVTTRTTAALWVRLMREVLGYGRFAAHGGDWGASVTAQLGHEFPDDLIGAHMTMPVLIRSGFLNQPSRDECAPEELPRFDRAAERMKAAEPHWIVHSRDPQTLAYALEDSPVGLAAWILERRRAWSGHGGDVFDAISRDALLTGVSIYWFTRTIGSSMRYYWENARMNRVVHDRMPAIEVPVGVTAFPDDLVYVPRRRAEAELNISRWTDMPRGGHFAAIEQPALLVDDIRAFFESLAG